MTHCAAAAHGPPCSRPQALTSFLLPAVGSCAGADLENTLTQWQGLDGATAAAAAVPAAAEDGAVVEVSLEAPGQEKAKMGPPLTVVSKGYILHKQQHLTL